MLGAVWCRKLRVWQVLAGVYCEAGIWGASSSSKSFQVDILQEFILPPARITLYMIRLYEIVVMPVDCGALSVYSCIALYGIARRQEES
jgi:hypothetical protein